MALLEILLNTESDLGLVEYTPKEVVDIVVDYMRLQPVEHGVHRAYFFSPDESEQMTVSYAEKDSTALRASSPPSAVITLYPAIVRISLKIVRCSPSSSTSNIVIIHSLRKYSLFPVLRQKEYQQSVYLQSAKNHARGQDPFSCSRQMAIIIVWAHTSKARTYITDRCGN